MMEKKKKKSKIYDEPSMRSLLALQISVSLAYFSISGYITGVISRVLGADGTDVGDAPLLLLPNCRRRLNSSNTSLNIIKLMFWPNR